MKPLLFTPARFSQSGASAGSLFASILSSTEPANSVDQTPAAPPACDVSSPSGSVNILTGLPSGIESNSEAPDLLLPRAYSGPASLVAGEAKTPIGILKTLAQPHAPAKKPKRTDLPETLSMIVAPQAFDSLSATPVDSATGEWTILARSVPQAKDRAATATIRAPQQAPPAPEVFPTGVGSSSTAVDTPLSHLSFLLELPYQARTTLVAPPNLTTAINLMAAPQLQLAQFSEAVPQGGYADALRITSPTMVKISDSQPPQPVDQQITTPNMGVVNSDPMAKDGAAPISPRDITPTLNPPEPWAPPSVAILDTSTSERQKPLVPSISRFSNTDLDSVEPPSRVKITPTVRFRGESPAASATPDHVDSRHSAPPSDLSRTENSSSPSSDSLPLSTIASSNAATPQASEQTPHKAAEQPARPAPVTPRLPQPPPATAASQIALRLDAGGENGHVELRIRERAGEVQIAVRSADAGVATSLRQDLGDLLKRLDARSPTSELSRTESAPLEPLSHSVQHVPGGDASRGHYLSDDAQQQQERQRQQQQSRSHAIQPEPSPDHLDELRNIWTDLSNGAYSS